VIVADTGYDPAFARAHTERATLLVAFVGHGVSTGPQDFFLLARDSPQAPTSRAAFHLPQGIRENLNGAPSLDGLIVLVDACQTAEGARGAAQRWPEVHRQAQSHCRVLPQPGRRADRDPPLDQPRPRPLPLAGKANHPPPPLRIICRSL
jgi:hypothetical protein